MAAPNNATIHDLEAALRSLYLASAPLDKGDPLKECIDDNYTRVQHLLDDTKRLRDNR